MSNKPTITDEVGTRLLFENERVRVWDLRLEPGQRTGFHRHNTDYFYIVIGDGTLQGVKEDGNLQPERDMKDGEVHFRCIDDQDVHDAVNTGSTAWRNIVVELKEPRSEKENLPSVSPRP